MSELRLIPLAATLWVATALVVLREPTVAIILVIAGGAAALILRQPGQAVLVWCGGSVATLVAWLRVRAVGVDTPTWVRGIVVEHPKQIREGVWKVTVDAQNYPVDLPVMLRGSPPAAGALVEATVRARPSDRAGLLTQVFSTREFVVMAPPHGWYAATGHIRETFARAAETWLSVQARGLVPGMVLGDTNMQSDVDRQLYIDTGLSHLTAVSGSNVALVVTAAFALARLASATPKIQVVAAGTTLAVYLGLVGAEPSVLRAGATGMVGLLAVINSSKLQPVHGLALAVSGLVLWDSDLAVQYGFALSVAATAGIVVLQPLLVPPLAQVAVLGRRMPDVLVRALGVAIAADVVTAPIIAMMTGKVPLVSVLANILAAPVVGVITLVGLVAVVVSLLPGGLEAIPLAVVEPCARWIHVVAAGLAGPQLVAPLSWVLLGSVWIVYLFHCGYGRAIIATGVACAALWSLPGLGGVGGSCGLGGLGPLCGPEEIPVAQLSHVVEQKIDSNYEPPAGTQVIVVLDSSGTKRNRPTKTRGGIPVLYPNRDGEVALYSDGTQHARDGRF